MFHVQLRQFPNVAREFNLTEEQLRTRILTPWAAGAMVRAGERQWAPERTKLTIYEGPELPPEDIGMGRGWPNVTKRGRDVTVQLLSAAGRDREAAPAPPPAGELDRCKLEIVKRAREGGIDLADCAEIAASLRFGSRVSERIALAEQAVWELLHTGAIELVTADAEPAADAADWQRVLLDWGSWSAAQRPRFRAPPTG